MKKIIIFSGILVFIILIAVFSDIFPVEDRDEEDLVREEILDYAVDYYVVYTAAISEEKGEPVLFFDVNSDTVDINKFHADILDKLKEYDLADKYTIEIEQTTSEEETLERYESIMIEIVDDYLKENGMGDDIGYEATIGENANINLSIPEDSNFDKEELEELMEHFLDVEIEVEE
ncbi:hypothetical protein [Oceanobacillus jeddahense]|uniref:Stage III sporulation protein AH n=1 Tax=Oceanobacillus jeddahense TaxID=1462527 RepID=A0ABY5JU85_9BACI|nr:hypothetical protein [Oceanobacillus jeddahense]UUI02124.1 hypothetical protein NP439_19080 [Oceanobacillus jeddahense]